MKERFFNLFALAASGLGLTVFASLGFFSRLFTDDYCYSYHYQQIGLLETLRGYYFITIFTAHRYSLTIFEWVIDRFGVLGIQLTPLVIIVAWGAGIWLLISESNRILDLKLKRLEIVLFTATLLFFSLYLAPNLYQSLYWRTGVLPYTAPLVAGLWMVYYLLQSGSSKYSIKYWILGLAGFVAAGFSEAGAVFTATLFGFIIISSLLALIKKEKSPWIDYGRPAILPVVSILIALVIMYLSPVNTQRQVSYQAPAAPLTALLYALKFAYDFLWLSIRTQPLPNLVFCLVVVGFSLLTGEQLNWRLKKFLLVAIVTAVCMYLILVAVHLPSAYVEKSPPADRTLIIMRFTMLAAEMIESYLIGQWLKGFHQYRFKTIANLAAISLVCLGCVYIFRASVVVLYTNLPRYQRVAQVWDERDRQIRELKGQGASSALVLPIDSQYIGGLMELYPNPNWVNICAAHYYGMDEIYAASSW